MRTGRAELQAAGEARAAAAVLQRLAAVDPLNEQAAVGLMRAYALAGQRHLALGAYRRLQARLADELAVPFEAARTRERLAAFEPPAAARRLREAARSTYRRLGAAHPSLSRPPGRPSGGSRHRSAQP